MLGSQTSKTSSTKSERSVSSLPPTVDQIRRPQHGKQDEQGQAKREEPVHEEVRQEALEEARQKSHEEALRAVALAQAAALDEKAHESIARHAAVARYRYQRQKQREEHQTEEG